MRIKLTQYDYFMANRRDYLEVYPDKKEMLIYLQTRCLPLTCEMCYFFRWRVQENGYIPECALGDVEYQFEHRAKGCPIEKEVKASEQKAITEGGEPED